MSEYRDYQYLPDAEAWLDPENEEPDRTLNPYFRPDALPEKDEPEPFEPSWLPDLPTEPCPCCGAEIPENPAWGFICPVCGWEIDYDIGDDSDAPSDQNGGLSLNEAQWNFHTFGRAVIMDN